MYCGPVVTHILPESPYSFSGEWCSVLLWAPSVFSPYIIWHLSHSLVLAFRVGAICVAVARDQHGVQLLTPDMMPEHRLSLHTHISGTNLCYSIM